MMPKFRKVMKLADNAAEVALLGIYRVVCLILRQKP